MQATASIERAAPAASPAQSRHLQWLLAGSSVSMLGSRVTAIAYPMLVLWLTGSPIAAGWAAFAATVPTVLLHIPAGALVDRWEPWRTMLRSEIGRGLAIGAMVALLVLGRLDFPLLITLAVVEESLEVFSALAERRFIHSLVEPGQEPSALARTEAREHTVVLVGRPLGGFLFGFARILPFLTDALSFAVSVGVLVGIRSGRQPDRTVQVPGRHLTHEIRQGMHCLLRSPYARVAVPVAASTTLVAQALIMIFLSEAHARQLPSVVVGMVLAASGAGGALGSVAVQRLRLRRGRSRLQIQLWIWVLAFTLLLLCGYLSFLWMAAIMATIGITGAMSNIERNTYLVQEFPDTLLARVMSIDRLISFSAFAIGPALGGTLVQWCGARGAVGWLLAITVCLAAISSLAPAMRMQPSSVHNGSQSLRQEPLSAPEHRETQATA